MSVGRRLIASGSPFEPVIGFSRAVVDGRHVSVSGTAPVMADGGDPPPDAYGQTTRVLEIILAALAEAGAGPEHVNRTRTYLTNAEDWQDVGSRTTFKIDTHDKDYRYYMVWLRLSTSGGQAEIDEVTAKT